MAEKKRIEPKDPEAVEPAAGARKAEQRAAPRSKRKSVVNRKSVVRRKSTSRRKLG